MDEHAFGKLSTGMDTHRNSPAEMPSPKSSSRSLQAPKAKWAVEAALIPDAKCQSAAFKVNAAARA